MPSKARRLRKSVPRAYKRAQVDQDELEMGYDEIGEIFGFTPQRVGQVAREALRKLYIQASTYTDPISVDEREVSECDLSSRV